MKSINGHFYIVALRLPAHYQATMKEVSYIVVNLLISLSSIAILTKMMPIKEELPLLMNVLMLRSQHVHLNEMKQNQMVVLYI